MKLKRIGTFAVLTGLVATFGFAPAQASANGAGIQCQQKDIDVTLSPSDGTTYTVAAELCYEGSQAGKTIQVLEHGTASSADYWNFPYLPHKYSYVQDQVNKGYVTLAIDTFGSGESDRPPAEQVTLPANAYVVHQVVQRLRDGSLSGTAFSKVVLVGHSSGAGVSLYEAGTYHDVDGVVVSGLLHDGALPVEAFSELLYPASFDPKFASASDIENYFTYKPGAGSFFFNTQFADPAVVAVDEQLKGSVSLGDLNTFFLPLLPGFTNQVDVPVLLAVGENDKAYCDATKNLPCGNADQILAREATHYAPEACLEAKVVHVAAHNLNLHPNARAFFDESSDWIARRVGNGTQLPAQPC